MPALGLPALPALDLDPEAATVITYTYDSLYRLTAADYSTGIYFHYTYDSAGNRLTQTLCTGTGCTPVNTNYVYDNANRMTSIGGVTQTWDNNGNLLDDGTSTFTYDAANRLISAADGIITTTLTYNGLGDRVQQTVDETTTDYTLDLNAGLTQVLADGNNTYLYGLDRIGEQQPGGFVYHLSDGLGSVRQLANAAGIVTRARSYEPFGSVLSTASPANTTYGFAGEQRDDSTGLTFLRARYLSSSTGRFLTMDTWGGEPLLPITQNGWVYANADPVNFTDPSGRCVFVGIDTAICVSAGVAVVAAATVVVGVAAIAYNQWAFQETIRAHDGGGFPNGVEIYPAGRPSELPDSSVEQYPIHPPGELQGGNVEVFPLPLQRQLDELTAIFVTVDALVEYCRHNPIPFPLPPIRDLRSYIYASKPYDFGQHRDISQPPGDSLDSHHVPQWHPARQVIPDLNHGDAPAIALRPEEHQSIPRLSGPYYGTDRDLLANDINNLRTYTNTPRGVIRDFLRYIKQSLPGAFKK